MSERVVEMIEALQAKWREDAAGRRFASGANQIGFYEGSALSSDGCANDLTPILAAAREQEKELIELNAHRTKWENKDGTLTDYAYLVKLEQELAALHEQIMRYQADPQYDARFLDGQDKTLAAMKEQHSDDLREIAEMVNEEWLQKVGAYLAVHGWNPIPVPQPDSILREFREKQQKAEVGK